MPPSIAPSSRPPPTSGGGIYIVLAVALVAAIVGLVYWKIKGSNETPTAAVNTAPIVTTAAPLAEAPPPPPPIDEPVAVVDAGGPRAVTTTAYSPCGVARCGGSGSSALETALSARAGSARPCYERALRVNATLQGKLMVNVRVDPQGNVCATSVVQDDIHSPEVSNCVMGMFRSAKFPAPSGGCLDVKVPLNFTPKEGR